MDLAHFISCVLRKSLPGRKKRWGGGGGFNKVGVGVRGGGV